MNYCKVCGKKLELTPEYDMCMECQGKQHRTFTLPYNGGVNANHTEMTAKEALERIIHRPITIYPEGGISTNGVDMNAVGIVSQALTELEAIKSVDGGEALKVFWKIAKGYEERAYKSQYIPDKDYEDWEKNIIDLKNYILKAQAQEQELRELKCTALNYLSCVSNDIDQSLYGLDVAKSLRLLCMKGSEE